MTQLPPTQPPPGSPCPGGPPPGGQPPQWGWGPPGGTPPAGPPPGVGPPGWGAQQPPPPQRTNRTPLIIAGLAALAAVVLIVVLVSSGGDDDGSGGNEVAGQGEDGQQNPGSLPENMPTLPTIPEGGPGGGGGAPAEGSLGPGAREDPDAPGGVAAEPDANGNLPEDVVTNFFEAASNGDCQLFIDSISETAWSEYLGASSADEAMEQCQSSSPPAGASLESAEYGGMLLEPDAELQADGMRPFTALVDVVTSDGAEQHMWLIIEDGLWKIY